MALSTMAKGQAVCTGGGSTQNLEVPLRVRRQSLHFRVPPPAFSNYHQCGQLRRLRLLLVLLGLLLVLEPELELGLGQEVGRGLVPQTDRYGHSTVADFVWPNSSKIP